ncbi:MAG TPA: ABC transporter permease [Vicinamibacterales bacterium]
MRDLRYAVRVLIKSPVFTIAAVLTLALCIGANTAIYTVVDRVILRPLPYPEPDRLAMVVRHDETAGINEDDTGQAGAAWEALQRGAIAKLDFAVTAGGSQGVNFVSGARAEYVKQQRVSAGYFRVLQIAPELGREFSDEEDRVHGPAATILSHDLWTHAFDADPSVIGRRVTLRGEPYTVVGVMPAAFHSVEPVDLWTPVRPSPTGEGGGENYTIIARLRSGVSWPEADALVGSATDALARERYGKGHKGNADVRLRIVPLQSGQANDLREPLIILWSAVGMVLLIGCVNLAGLLLARSATRVPEIATRMAIGGGRAAIVRQLLAESIVLAVAGGAVGIAIGYAGSQLFASLLEHAFGVPPEVGLDWRVLLVTGGASLATSLLFGLFPAYQATRINLREALVQSGGNVAGPASRWPRRLMVVAQVALGVVLLVGAGLMIRTLNHLMNLRAGFDETHVMTASLSLQDARYATADRVNRLFEQTLARLAAVPGVQSAAVCLTLPYERALNVGGRWVSAKPGAEVVPTFNETYVTANYFDTFRIPLVRGRYLNDGDRATTERVMVVNQEFVRRNSPLEDPLGREVGPGTPRRIVGVVGDIQQKAGWGNFGPVNAMAAAYIPASQVSDSMVTMVHTWFAPSWVVRTAGPLQGIVPAMTRSIEQVDPQLPFAKFRTIDDVRGEAVATPRAQAVLLGSLAALALLLSAIGLYGLVANSVAERTRELGIRMALGATPAATVRVAALPGVVFGGIGLVVGLALARASSVVMQHLVWGVTVGDPVTYALATGVVLLVAAIATLVPALRILKLNPIRALRQS